MTTISSTSAYSVSSLYNTKKTSASSSGGLDLDDSTSNGSRKSVFTADWDEAGSSASSSSASLKLSSQLWDLMSTEDAERDSVESQGFTTGTDDASSGGSAENEFLNLSNLTLAERIRQKYLDDNNLSEDDLKSMNADDRAKIEDEIRQQVQAAMKELQNVSKNGEVAASTDTTQTQQV